MKAGGGCHPAARPGWLEEAWWWWRGGQREARNWREHSAAPYNDDDSVSPRPSSAVITADYLPRAEQPSISQVSEKMASTASSEGILFVEKEEVFVLIGILASLPSSSPPSLSVSPDADAALSKLRTILDKYLECPTLLDPYLETIVMKLSLHARRIVHDLFIAQFRGVNDNAQSDEATGDSPDDIRDESDVPKKLETLMHLLSAIYAISKVRGRKYVQRLLPHEVADVEPVLVVLRWFGWIDCRERLPEEVDPKNGYGMSTIPHAIKLFQTQRQQQNQTSEAQVWESVHSLLTWLGITSLVPFDLRTIDSSLNQENVASHDTITLVQSILAASASHLADYGATRETAAACLASLLSRPDLEQSELDGFLDWSARVMYQFRTGKEEKESSSSTISLLPGLSPSIFLTMGVLQTLASIFKTGHRSNLYSTQHKLRNIEHLWEQAILLAEGPVGSSILVRKLLVKLFARFGCAYLPPRVASWRYQRGKRSLVENLLKGGSSESKSNDEAGLMVDSASQPACESDVLFPIPDHVEDAMDQLLRSLTDTATIVRWSGAKGIGRLTERLPAICADDVLDAILLLFLDSDRDKAWHGACLALAELARRGLLLPARLSEVVPKVVQAIGFDVRRGQHSVGAHVRDASCYVCWAFARAYLPTVLRPYVKQLSEALVLTSLFDREVNCRRAASAAFQESVGRQGADNFKHGIAILTTADYYSLGNRNDCFLTLALSIAKFEEYQIPIILHLAFVKLRHWDIDIRTLASRSLSGISKLNPCFTATVVLPKLLDQCLHKDLVVRHGSLLGVAEIVLAFGEADLVERREVLNATTIVSIVELIPSVEKARLYRGRGGEIMRSASCRMIECVSLAGLSMTVYQQVRLLDSVDACLVHPNENIQNSAAKALNALLTKYFPVGSNGPSPRLQNRVVDKYISIVQTEDNPAATRGFSLALGHLPSKLLAPSRKVLDSVLGCLCDASKIERLVGGEGDAETRRNAIISLVKICTEVGICGNECTLSGPEASPVYRLRRNQIDQVFGTLLAAMGDYNTDRRGDVGSWSRIAAMDGLETLTILSIKASTTFPHSSCQGPSHSFSSPDEVIAPPLKERMTSLASDQLINCQQSFLHQKDHMMLFDERLCCAVLSALLKQLGEKLDNVRLKAGECLERLLMNRSPRLPFVHRRHSLVLALSLKEHSNNWADPSLTFPLIMRAANIDEFTGPIISGIVVSVGGLTESVSKSSSAALFEWIRELRSANATPKIFRMGEVFIGLFLQHKRNVRVLLPLLSTLDKLLSHKYLDELLCAGSGNFSTKLMACLVAEAKGSSDIKLLLAIVGVSLALLEPHIVSVLTMRQEILPFIMVMLLNPYPRVRRCTAEQLYVKLAEDGDILFDRQESVEKANQTLLGTTWHKEDDPLGELTLHRNRIADLLGIHLTDEERNVKIGKRSCLRSTPKDEFQCYSSLVRTGERNRP